MKWLKPRMVLFAFISAIITLLSEFAVVAAPESSAVIQSESYRLVTQAGKVWSVDGEGVVQSVYAGDKHLSDIQPSITIPAVFYQSDLYQVVRNQLRYFSIGSGKNGVAANLPHSGKWLLSSTDSYLWLASGKSLYRVDGKSLQEGAQLASIDVPVKEIAFLGSRGKHVYIASYRSLFKFEEGRFSQVKLPTRNAITGIWATDYGIIVASDSQLTAISNKHTEIKTVYTGVKIQDVLSYNHTLFIVSDRGLFVWNPDEMEEPAFSSAFDPTASTVIDEYGRIWVSDERGVRTMWLSNLIPTKSRSLPSDGAISLIGEDGIFWARGGRIVRADQYLNQLAEVRVSGEVTSLVERKSVLWATISGRLYSFDTLTLERLYTTVPAQIDNIYVNELFIDGFDTLWLTGTGELFRWWPETGTVNTLHTFWVEGDAANTEISSLVDTGLYGIWLGSNQGLYQYVHGSFFRFLPSMGVIDNIYFDGINRMYVESQGQKWKLEFAKDSTELIQEEVALDAIPVCKASPGQGLWAVYSNNVVFNGVKWTSWKSERLNRCGIFGESLITVSEDEVSSTPVSLVRDILSARLPSFDVTPYSQDDRQSWPILRKGLEHTLVIQSDPLLPHVGIKYQVESENGASEWKHAPHGHITDLADQSGDFRLHIHQSVPPYAHTDVTFNVKSEPIVPLYILVGFGTLLSGVLLCVFIYRRQIDEEAGISHEESVQSSLNDAEFLQKQLDTVAASKEITAIRPRSIRTLRRTESNVPAKQYLPKVSDSSGTIQAVLPLESTLSPLPITEGEGNKTQALQYSLWQSQVETVVSERFSDPAFSLAELASRLHLSERSIQRRFQKVYKQTFRDFLTQYRLERAAEILLNENCLVSDVAEECGFNELSYFGARFKAKYGETPSQYMSRNKEY
ncbi:AraC family transcriptional regulator [Parasalinivibrio latis]|uniref:helix-turn-helix domain-containing protein n=1 Tax=Parasalinivibrio latis TaxID=2952610 RepID=UPI0030E2B0DF